MQLLQQVISFFPGLFTDLVQGCSHSVLDFASLYPKGQSSALILAAESALLVQTRVGLEPASLSGVRGKSSTVWLAGEKTVRPGLKQSTRFLTCSFSSVDF